MPEQIPLFEIPWDVQDLQNVIESIGRGGWWANGPFIEEFEQKVASYLGVEHAVAVNSGTSAIMAALDAAGIGDGDEVIVPSFTQQATVNAVKMVGGNPVFADIERETYGLDPTAVSEQVTSETEAVLPVHVYGSVCDIEAIYELATDHNLMMIEDAAEAQGAERDGMRAGTVGDAGALSFCQNKIVPTGEGGMVVTDDDEIARGVSLYRSHGRASEDYFESSDSGRHVTVGGNFRMPDMVAALGCSQMERIDTLIEGRRRAALTMNDAFESTEGVSPHTMNDGRHVYQFYTVTFDLEIDRDAVIEHLAERNISSKVYWNPPVHESEFYSGSDWDLPVTEELSQRVLALPMHPELSPREVERIIDGVQTACKKHR
ncbi:DegT/DnrJ/EryC1/StrS family aminotransferase [Halosimplex pelagicum]|uniref:DegT/DnrJ/EryC1/StrS family aminotransferase n=1 Tax=Halosimplex pelagicum TaxID=869886 RepID=A0A7D5PA20_9EURY|nr:DegT/DnrJ/EryC1/StrS family aminotransferase [Halosimplex pelagicum]QLH81202.1 DegT/DnrJ/EryC1/StrS family aminotransferase [Halosimplex pelagicum]